VFNVTPLGNAPDSLNVGAGLPVVVTVKLPAVPTVNVVLLALVIAGGVVFVTISMNVCTALLPTPLLAVNVIVNGLPIVVVGVPLSTPVVVFNVTPLGNAPVSLYVGAG